MDDCGRILQKWEKDLENRFNKVTTKEEKSVVLLDASQAIEEEHTLLYINVLAT